VVHPTPFNNDWYNEVAFFTYNQLGQKEIKIGLPILDQEESKP
jgi:hypothetical protein